MNIRIAFLADHPEYLDQVAFWHWDEWDREMLGLSLEEVTQLVRECSLHKDQLDINLIALTEDNQCIGTIELADNEFLPGWEETKPWRGSLYVMPEWRNQGIGTKLKQAAKNAAANLNFEAIHVFISHSNDDYLIKEGFKYLDNVNFADENWHVYRADLVAAKNSK